MFEFCDSFGEGGFPGLVEAGARVSGAALMREEVTHVEPSPRCAIWVMPMGAMPYAAGACRTERSLRSLAALTWSQQLTD